MANSNGKTWRIVVIVVTVVFSGLAVAYGYGRYSERVDTLQATAVKADANQLAIVGMEKDIAHIRKTVDEIKEQLRDGGE